MSLLRWGETPLLCFPQFSGEDGKSQTLKRGKIDELSDAFERGKTRIPKTLQLLDEKYPIIEGLICTRTPIASEGMATDRFRGTDFRIAHPARLDAAQAEEATDGQEQTTEGHEQTTEEQ